MLYEIQGDRLFTHEFPRLTETQSKRYGQYAVRLSLSAVGGYLKRWGLSVQGPVKRAYERNEEAIAQWLHRIAVGRRA